MISVLLYEFPRKSHTLPGGAPHTLETTALNVELLMISEAKDKTS